MWNARALLFVLVSMVSVACGGSDDHAAAEATRCERARDHLVDLRVASVTADREEHRTIMRRALGTEFVEGCERSMSDDQLTCILNADDSAEAAGCVPPAK